MDFRNKIIELQRTIRTKLGPLIGERCVLADAPYYENIGDVLIWQGIEDFLKSQGKNLLQINNISTFRFSRMSNNITILLTGGGNFGDLYRVLQDFRLKVVANYPHNRIVMFPQSVWYDDESLIEKDAKIFAAHNDLYLCARDRWSYEFMKKHFSANNILLVPDMAFCIDESRLEQYRDKATSRKLYCKRTDKEIQASTQPELDAAGYEIHDWPSVENSPKALCALYKICRVASRLKNFPSIAGYLYAVADKFASTYIRSSLVATGCRFLAPYNKIVTTRLHALILSVLLHKQVEYIDNSTRKLSAFVNTWLTDLESVTRFK